MNFKIGIPIYNNPEQLEICLQSLQNQKYLNFDVELFDDCSTVTYLNHLNDNIFPVLYNRHKSNIGALKNMQFAYKEISKTSNYAMVMHEDDILHPKFIEVMCNVITETPEVAFIICQFSEFKENSIAEFLVGKTPIINYRTRKQITDSFLSMEPYAFGSVVYNTTHYPEMKLEMDKYGEFADRPFLIKGLNENDLVACIDVPLYGYRSHEGNDTRWKLLNSEHVFSLLDF